LSTLRLRQCCNNSRTRSRDRPTGRWAMECQPHRHRRWISALRWPARVGSLASVALPSGFIVVAGLNPSGPSDRVLRGSLREDLDLPPGLGVDCICGPGFLFVLLARLSPGRWARRPAERRRTPLTLCIQFLGISALDCATLKADGSVSGSPPLPPPPSWPGPVACTLSGGFAPLAPALRSPDSGALAGPG
jgi:hypothetical protein